MNFFLSQLLAVVRRAQRMAMALVIMVGATQAVLAASGFTRQMRLGYRAGDQWEPAMAADTHGHIYVLYPQYGPVADCRMCTAPIMALVVSEDNGISWHSSRPMLPFPTGQFDPQIVVDPVDHQTVYASWLQNEKRDIVVARSLDFGRTWSFSWAERGQEDADKPTLAVHGADVYVGFNHEEKLFVAASHDAGQTFSSVVVNPNAEPGFSLAGGATVDPAGNLYIGWTAYARRHVNYRPVSIYFSRSADGGRTWTTALLDQSSAPPGCEPEKCQTGYLGPQIALASDAAGALYALWNAGAVKEERNAFTFHPQRRREHPGRREWTFPEPEQCRACISRLSLPDLQEMFVWPGWIRERRSCRRARRSGILSTAVPRMAELPGDRNSNCPAGREVTTTFSRRIPLSFWRLLRYRH